MSSGSATTEFEYSFLTPPWTAGFARYSKDEIAPPGPYLDGANTLIAAVGRELDALVVSRDGDLTHEATKQVVDVKES